MLELCLIIIIVIGIHAERLFHQATIEGVISSSSPNPSVVAIKGNDSIKVVSNNGHFGMELQPGDWKLIFASQEINGIQTEKNVQVLEGQRLNMGVIHLAQ